MFYLDEKAVQYRDPWTTSFSDRLLQLTTAKYRIAYLYESPDNSTFRYRVYNMIQSMSTIAGVSAAFFRYDELDQMRRVIESCDVLIVCRCRYTNMLHAVISLAKRLRRRVYYDIDDMVYNTDYTQLILHTLDQDLAHPGIWDFWFAYISRMRAGLDLCDGAIATNLFLSNRITIDTGLQTVVIPNFLNNEQIAISERLMSEKRYRRFQKNETFHLGYFSGSPSHNKDFDVLATTLVDLFKEYPHLKLRILGFLSLKNELLPFADRVEFYPLHDFVNLQRQIAMVEANLVPLIDNEFTNCKSELKYFEAAAVGTVTIATPTYTYSRAIVNGKNGFLANSYDWYSKIKSLVDEKESYATIAESAHQHAYKEFDGRSMGQTVVDAISRLHRGK